MNIILGTILLIGSLICFLSHKEPNKINEDYEIIEEHIYKDYPSPVNTLIRKGNRYRWCWENYSSNRTVFINGKNYAWDDSDTMNKEQAIISLKEMK